MLRCLIATTATLALIGCATNRNPLPPDYSGPIAVLRDSVANYDGTKADYFFLYKYNGTAIRQTLDVSEDRNQGRYDVASPRDYRAISASAGGQVLPARAYALCRAYSGHRAWGLYGQG
jgi:hypothetical protein